MGLYGNGILGAFFGKVGAVIGSKWKNKTYMRQKGPDKRNNNSEFQKEQQAKFKVAVDFVANMIRLFKITYKGAQGMTPRNNALRNVLEDAITGTSPNYSIDFSKVPISKGRVPIADGATASVAGSILTWRWTPGDPEDVTLSDHAIVAFYCPETGQSRYRMNLGSRASGTASFDVSAFAGRLVHTYLFFRTEDGDKFSNSIYTGEVQIA